AGVENIGRNNQSRGVGGFDPVPNGEGFVVGVADVGADFGEGGIGDALLKEDLAGDVVLASGEAHFVGGAGPGAGDKNERGVAVTVKFGGGKGPGFETAAEQDDGIGFLQGVIDNPEAGGGAEEGDAEKVESGEKDHETTGQKDNGPEEAAPAARAVGSGTVGADDHGRRHRTTNQH